MGCSSSKAAGGSRHNTPARSGKGGANTGFVTSVNDRPSSHHSTLIEGLRYNMVKLKDVNLEDLYTVTEEELGSAGMGCIVRTVRKKATGEMFACKSFNMQSVPDKKVQVKIRNMLRNEIELLRSLDHPNVVRAYERIESGGCIHLIMELCEGGDLTRREPYTEAQAAVIICKVLRAIVYCHRHGVCHRDLKFENVLWEAPGRGADGEPKLIDFGMSRKFARGAYMRERVGTVYTMAPEVLRGEYTEQADVWSIGCMAFQLIAGEPAFECETEADTMVKLQTVTYSWPRGMAVSSEAKEFVYKLLKFDPTMRMTAQEALASPWLRKHCSGSKVGSPGRDSSMLAKTLNSIREYRTYGPFKRRALMVLAYHLRPQQMSHIRDEFAKFDADDTGAINKDELRAALEGQGVQPAEVDALFESMDVDQSGKIRYFEFLAAALGAMDEAWLSETRLRDAFQHMDVDGSGFIVYADLKSLLGREYKPEIVQQMMKEANLEPGARGVTYDQFVELMQAGSKTFVETEMSHLEMREEVVLGSPAVAPRGVHKKPSFDRTPRTSAEQAASRYVSDGGAHAVLPHGRSASHMRVAA
ncbi:kinase-like domain-containing protein [Tribonema minus]|uniref:Kinase-like domain-containing protein n=1 Tax=Tribonema minus TaxID=303371 RepID=A0A835Z9R7_9STRA|nr:kinase-like domain-containing protein [Tribonema minus]